MNNQFEGGNFRNGGSNSISIEEINTKDLLNPIRHSKNVNT